MGRDDTVALLMPTLPQTVVALFGAQAAGRVCPINYMLSSENIAQLIDHAGASVLVALGPDPDFPIWKKLPEIRRLSKRLRHVVVAGGAPQGMVPDLDALIAEAPVEPGFDTDIDRDTVAAYYHTGGTTGAPKLVVHRHGNEVHVSWFARMAYDIGPDDVVLNGFPLFHVAGAFVLLGAAIAAGAATLIPSKHGMRSKNFVRDYWRIVERYRVTLLSGGPTFVSTIMNKSADDSDITHVKALFGGGSSMPTELAAGFEARFGVPVRSIYGMTEAAGMISVIPRHAERLPGSSGWPLPFCKVRAFAPAADGGPDPQRPLPAGKAGMLAICGPNVSPGYTNPEMTRAAFISRGWFATGDTGRVDPDGQVFVLGRSKDVIIRGGHNIDPLVIENAIMHHPDVELCAAVGEPDPYAGELPVVFLKLKPHARVDPRDILDSIKIHIPEPAAVPKQVYILDNIPLTTTGKVYKPALRQIAAERALSRQLAEILPKGHTMVLTCREVLGQRHVEICLDPTSTQASREAVAAHMAHFPLSYTIQCE